MPWSRGKRVSWDFTCPDTLAVSQENRAVTGPGEVANEAERRKTENTQSWQLGTNSYRSPSRRWSLGPIGTEATSFLRNSVYLLYKDINYMLDCQSNSAVYI